MSESFIFNVGFDILEINGFLVNYIIIIIAYAISDSYYSKHQYLYCSFKVYGLEQNQNPKYQHPSNDIAIC